MAALGDVREVSCLLRCLARCLCCVPKHVSHALVSEQRQCGACRVAKLAGDKRADVAEKGFGRPFSRVVIAQSSVSTSN